MPEGDTIFRAARALHRALEGREITHFDTVYPQLSRVDRDQPMVGRTVQRVSAVGKHLLMHLSGELILRSHMRMNGSWHIYRPGEKWRIPAYRMKITLETGAFVAVAFDVPIAEFETPSTLERSSPVGELGPDLSAKPFDEVEAHRRGRLNSEQNVADLILNQRVAAGAGNVFKSEVAFLCGIHPFRLVSSLSDDQLTAIIATSRRLLLGNQGSLNHRKTTASFNPREGLWVYGRSGKPCRKCGGRIRMERRGLHARSTYFCANCQQ